MTLLLIFAYAVFAAVTIIMMVKPFLGTREEQIHSELLETELKRIEELVAKRAVLINALREVEFEYETSKVTEKDYKAFRARYERQAVAVMRELDAIHGGRGWEERIEEEIRERLGMPPEEAEPDVSAPEPVEQEQAEEPVEADGEEMAELVCAKCGAELEPDDKFCGQCGATVSAKEATA